MDERIQTIADFHVVDMNTVAIRMKCSFYVGIASTIWHACS